MGIVLSGVALSVVFGLVALLLRNPIGLLSFLLGLFALAAFVAFFVLVYWTYGYYSLFYILDRDAFRIHWAGFEVLVPLLEIRGMVDGASLASAPQPPLLRWPGYQIGWSYHERLGQVAFYTRQAGPHSHFVLTDSVAYAISPADPEGFRQALELRQSLGPVHRLQPVIGASPLLALPFWSDRLAHGLWVGALALNLGLFAYLCALYPGLPPIMPVHFDALGEVDRLAPAVVLFIVPAIGALGLLLNGFVGFLIHARQRLGTLLLWGGTVVIQSYLWIAVLGILSHGRIA